MDKRKRAATAQERKIAQQFSEDKTHPDYTGGGNWRAFLDDARDVIKLMAFVDEQTEADGQIIGHRE